ncbi:MAG: hypothetical protein H0X62_05650, partial [Bacteroidetes bacterium]|nr:hypothetical protein [Bacteroidota bacterium]
MKTKITLLFMLVMAGIMNKAGAQGQCLTGGCMVSPSQYPPTTQTNTSSTFASISGMFAGEFAECSVTSGNTYEWSLCPTDGAVISFNDSELTLFNASNNVVLCYSNDFCGLHAKISWTATFTGTVKIQINEWTTTGCGSNSSPTDLRWRTISNITNDAAVTHIYTYGITASPFSNPSYLQARVSNVGTASISALPVTVNVTGANTYTNTQTINLPSGSSAIVTFPSFHPTT